MYSTQCACLYALSVVCRQILAYKCVSKYVYRELYINLHIALHCQVVCIIVCIVMCRNIKLYEEKARPLLSYRRISATVSGEGKKVEIFKEKNCNKTRIHF